MSDTADLSQQALDHFIELLEKKDFKNQLVNALNEDVDIPFINEKTEKKVLDAIYSLVVKLMKKIEVEKLMN
jgi:replicative DNA helicase